MKQCHFEDPNYREDFLDQTLLEILSVKEKNTDKNDIEIPEKGSHKKNVKRLMQNLNTED